MALSLAEIVAAAKAAREQKQEAPAKQEAQPDSTVLASPSIASLPSDKSCAAGEAEAEELIFITSAKEAPDILLHTPSSYPSPNPALFLAIHAPYLRDPESFSVGEFRQYRSWLLSPSTYVIGAFRKIDEGRLFDTFMLHCPPTSILGLHRLASLLWEISLTVPQEYEEDFIRIIKEGTE